MKLLLVFNPQAGNGRARALLPQVEAYMTSKGLDVDVVVTEYEGHATEIVTQANFDIYDGIIASGGDGAMFEVLNGYYKNPVVINNAPNKPPLGLIPNGTGNAFMRELGLKCTDWEKSIDIIAKNITRKIDVGTFVTEGKMYYFLNIVGMGFVTQVAQASLPLKWMGNSAYTAATLLKLISLRSQKMTVELDGVTKVYEGIFVEVANSTYTGTTFLIAPKAKIDDGLLDVIILKKISRIKLLKLFTSIFDGSHIHHPEIEYIHAKSVKVEIEGGSQLIPDGEILGSTPVEFTCLKQDVEFLWDK